MTQEIPTDWAKREALREKGQFWTPSWLAEAMAAWVTETSDDVLFDPAVGPGTFFAAARRVGYGGSFSGFEPHPGVFAERDRSVLTAADFRGVLEEDFLGAQVPGRYRSVISNPPYIRHHRLSAEEKRALRELAVRCLGFPIDGRVGLHVYFLLKSLDLLAPAGRLAFLLPADVCEGISAARVWAAICRKFRLEAVLTFREGAAPFPQVDTNAMVLLISNQPPLDWFLWLQIEERDRDAVLRRLHNARLNGKAGPTRRLAEALDTGLSRPPRRKEAGVALGDYAKVVRGIATGANEFFFLTGRRIVELGLSPGLFRRAIGRTRDCPDSILNLGRLDALEEAGRPTWLLNLEAQQKRKLPAALKEYLSKGERQGLPDRPLISTRRPWYKMEQREAPPILFAYLGRRQCRFVLNRAGVVPLTGFLCVYPFDAATESVEKLWRALNHPDTLANLAFAAKSYGGGALKAEPRQLDRLWIPVSVLQEVGLRLPE